MSDRPRFFDDLAGVAGGAISALSGLREEAESVIRARIDDTIRRLDLVRREELDVSSGIDTPTARLTLAARPDTLIGYVSWPVPANPPHLGFATRRSC